MAYTDSEYGITKNGFVRKRFDVLYKEIQNDLSNGFGFDVSQNPQSFLNVLVASFADRLDALWELGEEVYYSQYPSSAYGVSLDNAAQYGGIKRKQRQKSRFYMSCTGNDGTILPSNPPTRFSTTTEPKVYVENDEIYTISRSNCTQIKIEPWQVVSSTNYTITVDGIAVTITSNSTTTAQEIAAALSVAINTAVTNHIIQGISASVDGSVVTVSSTDEGTNRSIGFSNNLRTVAKGVTSVFLFKCTEYGAVYAPAGSVTNIVSTISGLQSVTNIGEPTLGQKTETDVEFRQSYINKIASRSSMMLESIVSGILTEVDDVVSCTAYENTGDTTISYPATMLPHSILVVVDAPTSKNDEIAAMILKKKAAGINTNGTTTVNVPDMYNGTIPIKFSHVTDKTLYVKVEVWYSATVAYPANRETLIKDSILEQTNKLNAGDELLTQDFVPLIKESCSGISYIDILVSDEINGQSELVNPTRIFSLTGLQKAKVIAANIQYVEHLPNG